MLSTPSSGSCCRSVVCCNLILVSQNPQFPATMASTVLALSVVMLRRCLPPAEPSTLCRCLAAPQIQQYNAEAGDPAPLSCVQALAQMYSQGKRSFGDLQPGNVMLVQDSVKFVNWSASMAQGQGVPHLPLIKTLISVTACAALLGLPCCGNICMFSAVKTCSVYSASLVTLTCYSAHQVNSCGLSHSLNAPMLCAIAWMRHNSRCACTCPCESLPAGTCCEGSRVYSLKKNMQPLPARSCLSVCLSEALCVL